MNFIRKIFKKAGNEIYIGEKISQIQHMAQTAQLAEKAGFNKQVIVGSFLHDIGHLLPRRMSPRMEYDDQDLGVLDHELVGEQICIRAGLPKLTTDIIKNHVNAKRYLVSSQTYLTNLSDASYKTLKLQGGKMSDHEMTTFEKEIAFHIFIHVRKWEEQAKDPDIVISQQDIDRYFTMTEQLIQKY